LKDAGSGAVAVELVDGSAFVPLLVVSPLAALPELVNDGSPAYVPLLVASPFAVMSELVVDGSPNLSLFAATGSTLVEFPFVSAEVPDD
jgi:hypothetical protein